VNRLQALERSETNIQDSGIAAGATELHVPARQPSTRIPRRRSLIGASRALFSRLGYKATTLSEIARAGNCKRSTIQREFGRKVGLLEEVIRTSGIGECVQGPDKCGTSDFEEEICRLTAWEIERNRVQREQLLALLPRDGSDPIVWRVAGNLCFGGSHRVLHQHLRNRVFGDLEREFLVSAIQAIGFALGWTGHQDLRSLMPTLKRVANTLASGIEPRTAKSQYLFEELPIF
jgi:AcrR family transcriptional regulator